MTAVNANLFLTTCLLAGLALPAAGVADPPNDSAGRTNGRDRSDQPDGGGGEGRGGGQRPATDQRAPAPSAVAPTPPNDRRGRSGDGQALQFRPHGGQGQAQRIQPAGNPPVDTVTSPPSDANAADRTRGHWRRQAQTRPQGRSPTSVPPLGDWNRTVRGPDRDQEGQQWRQRHAGWDHDAP